MAVGVGFDCNPMIFAADESGIWNFIRFLGERKTSSSGPKYGSQFTEAFGKFYGQSRQRMNNDGGENSKHHGSIHENCITCIVSHGESGSSSTRRFSTSGLDGKIVIWDLENNEDLLEFL